MNHTYLQTIANRISISDLALDKSKDFVNAVNIDPYCQIQEAWQTPDGDEIIEVNVEVEIGQVAAYSIQRHELLAVVFDVNDVVIPKALALRPDFPLTPHLLTTNEAYPRSLCLFDRSYDELKIQWSGHFLLQQIRNWLALTARGELHGDDQPLEPLLPYSKFNLILPADFVENHDRSYLGIQSTISGYSGQTTFITKWVNQSDVVKNQQMFIAFPFSTAPVTHGLIHNEPKNLFELDRFLQQGGVSLLARLREELKALSKMPSIQLETLKAKLIIVIQIPKLRTQNQAMESFDIRSFLIDQTLGDIGVAVGVWGPLPRGAGSKYGYLLEIDDAQNGENLPVMMLNTAVAFSTKEAATMSGYEDPERLQITAVGVGALGSQVFMNCTRSGYGEWTLIDHDSLAPHNLSRHALTSLYMGYPKAKSLARVANEMLNHSATKAVVDNVLQPQLPDEIDSSLSGADLILDMSASVPVARHLAHYTGANGRRISLFLNPAGTDLVILAEDRQRTIPLDYLEMIYYRQLIQDSRCEDHLQPPDQRIRYATSCRDVSSRISQNIVASSAAIASHMIRQLLDQDEAMASIWQADTGDMTTNRIHIPIPQKCIKLNFGEWTLCTDQKFVEKVQRARTGKLPNETGGILIGSYDKTRKIIYVVDTILSPPDSQEWPNLYIRGFKRLDKKLRTISAQTGDNLSYVGEWHSHPDNAGCDPSSIDKDAFAKLKQENHGYDMPTLMLIAGDKNQYKFLLD